MTEVTYIKLFVDYLDAIEPLGDAERGRLFTSLLTYARTGEVPQLGGNERFLFPMMRAQIDRDVLSKDELSQKRREAASASKKSTCEQKEHLQASVASASKSPQDKDNKTIDKDKDKDKDNKSVRETTPTLFKRLLPDYILSDSLQAKMSEWIKYKTERKEPYKEQGMKSLLRQVENKAMQYGDDAVYSLIDECMANNWKGIIFDRLQNQRKPASGGYHRQTKAEELDDFYTMAENWSET